MKHSMKIMLAAGSVLATTVSAFGGIQMNSVFSEASLRYENDGFGVPFFGGSEDEHEYVVDRRSTLGAARAEAGDDPAGAAWSSVGRYDDGMRYTVSQGLSYGSMYSDPVDFTGMMYSTLVLTIDHEMQLDYSFAWSMNSARLTNGSFEIRRGSDTVHRRIYDAIDPAAGASILLGPGTYSLTFRLRGSEASGGMFPDWSSGNSRLLTTMNFSTIPAPGALALLGLAGCAWRRGRRV